MIEVAKRLDTVKEYYFSHKLKEVNLLKEKGNPIINLGIGSPDLQPPKKVIKAITQSLGDYKAHAYQSYNGISELREAMSKFYKKQFQVTMDSNNEILPLMGSKEGIMHISMAFLNEGDEVLIPNLGYPTYKSITELVGAKPIYYNLNEENNWLPEINELNKLNLEKVKIMWINYPHMPTGANATYKSFMELILFAKQNNILIINDNPYSFILNDSPKSIFKVEGAKEVCLELNSLSKTFNMAGWRIGMVLGNKEHINAILKVKSNMDSGMFYGIQKGAIEALKCSNLWYERLNRIYYKRRELIWKLADALNCTYNKNTTGLFVWAKIPSEKKSDEFIDEVLKKYNLFLSPGTVFGVKGEGYIRFSLCANSKDIIKAINRIK